MTFAADNKSDVSMKRTSSESAKDPSSNKNHPPVLLVVDDEEDLRDLIAEGMTLVGARVLRASDGKEALEIFGRETVDMVITDIFMPNVNGIELLNRIKLQDPHLPVILITGYVRKLRLSEECDIPPEACIEKPFSLQDLIRVVAGYLPGRLNVPIF